MSVFVSKQTKLIFLGFAVLALNAGGASAEPDKHNKSQDYTKTREHAQDGVLFTAEERHIIREVLAGVEHLHNATQDGKDHENDKEKSHKSKEKSGALPPGLAKRDALPPGLEMQLEKNGVLPPGLEKRDLPEDLRLRLGPPHKGTLRKIVGHDVVLLEEATGLILDIIKDVVN